MKEENIIKTKTYAFALRIIKLYKFLSKGNEYIISKQILRSGTAIGALIEEADQAESKSDFIHKMGIASKEANETNYWIRLLSDSLYIKENEADSILRDCEEVQKILIAIIKTAKRNKN